MIRLKSLLIEAVEAVGSDELTPEQYDQVEQMRIESGIHILSDRELDTVLLVDGEAAGTLYTSYRTNVFTFDIIVSKKFRGGPLAAALNRRGLEEYQQILNDDPRAKLELDVVNDKLIEPLQKWGLTILRKVGGHTIMGYVDPGEDPDIKAVADMNLPADDDYQPSEGESIYRVVWDMKKGQDIEVHDLGIVGLRGSGNGVYGIHVTSDPEYWKRRAGEDFGREVEKSQVINIYCSEGDMYVEDEQYATDPDTGIKASSFILLTKRKVLKYGGDWDFK